jgi:hypothetical protein
VLTQEYVRQILRGLEDGSEEVFFNHVSDHVDWIVMGVHPLAGHYHSKSDFVNGTTKGLFRVLIEAKEENDLQHRDALLIELRQLQKAWPQDARIRAPLAKILFRHAYRGQRGERAAAL